MNAANAECRAERASVPCLFAKKARQDAHNFYKKSFATAAGSSFMRRSVVDT